MRRAIIAESHRRDKSQEYLNIHRDNKLTKAEGVFGDLRLMGRGGAGSMCSLVCSQDLIKSFLDMCTVNANSFQNAYFSVFGTVEMPENTKVNTFFFFLLRKQSARVECRSPRSTCISSSSVPLSVGPRSGSLNEGRRGALQIHPSTPISINPSTTPSTSFKRGILGQPAPACPTNLQTQSSLQVLKYYRCSSCL